MVNEHFQKLENDLSSGGGLSRQISPSVHVYIDLFVLVHRTVPIYIKMPE